MGFRFRKSKKIGPVRLNLGKKGIGWSIGNKYIGYSHGASGRKSLRASIPGTGLSYITPLGRKKNRKKGRTMPQNKRNVKVTTEITDHTKQHHTTTPQTTTTQATFEEQRASLFYSIRFVAALFFVFMGICFFPSFASVFWWIAAIIMFPVKKFRSWIAKLIPIKPVRIAAGAAAGLAAFALSVSTATPETYTEDTSAETVYTVTAEKSDGILREIPTDTETPETVSETLDLLAKTPEKEPEPETVAETKPIETQVVETQKPDTQAPEIIPQEPETQAPVVVPETEAPETEPPKKTITITHKDSSLSPEMVEALEGVAAFWAPTGSKIHLNPFCRMFQGTVYAGTVEEANSVKDGGWCLVCSAYANESTKSNVNATPEVIASCYSYQDYINKIPAEFFDD